MTALDLHPGIKNRAILLLLGIVIMLAVAWPVTTSLANAWFYTTAFNHGPLIPVISGWVVWERRHLLAGLVPGYSLIGVMGLLAAAGLYWLGWLLSIQLFQQAALIGAVQAGILALFGWQILRVCLFPVVYLAFAVPFGNELIPVMQDITAAMALKGIELLGIPVYSDGTLIEVPGGMFRIAEACAGLRFLVASLALGALFAMVSFRSWQRRAAVMVLAIIVPIIANGIRALIMILLAYYSDMTIAVGFDHIVYGYVFLTVVMLALIGIGMTFSDRSFGDDDVTAADIAAARATNPGKAARGVVIAAAVALLATPVASGFLDSRPHAPMTPAAFPVPAGQWAASNSDWMPDYKGTAATIQGEVVGQGQTGVYIAFYARQKDGAEILQSINVDYSADWGIAERGRIAAAKGRPPMQYVRFPHQPFDRHFFKLMYVGGTFVTSTTDAKIRTALSRAGLAPEPAASVLLLVEARTKGEALQQITPLVQTRALADYLDRQMTGQTR